MSAPLELTGQVFTRLTVIERDFDNVIDETRWKVRCECGVEKSVGASDLRQGNTKSCGCLSRERAAENHLDRGLLSRATIGEDDSTLIITCTRCKEEKPASEFYQDRRWWKYSARCKPCDIVVTSSNQYGITPEEYMYRRKQSCGICGIYKEEPGKRGGGMHIDHDHQNNRLRGTLCDRCNRGIGMFDDDPEKLTAAIAYLLKWQRESGIEKKELA